MRRIGHGGEWRETPLADIAVISSGKRPPLVVKEATADCQIPVIGGGGPSGFTNSALFDGGILITGRVGTLGKLFAPSVPSWPSDNALVIRPNSAETHPRFLRYALQRVIAQAADMNRGAANPLITQGDLGRLNVGHPSLPEQRAIAHILGTLDDKIELNRRMSETLEGMARALFKSWFMDFDPVRAKAAGRDPGLPKELAALFPDSFQDSELGEIPNGWELKPIEDLADVAGGTTPSTNEQTYWEGGIHAWVTPKDLSALSVPILLDTERRITDAGLRQIGSGLLPQGTVLLSSRAPIGYLAIAEIPVAINQGFIAMKTKGGTSNLFLLFWASIAHEEIMSRANGSTFLEISKANFRPIPVIKPTTEVMQAFDQILRPLYMRLVACARESNTLAKMRDTLLPNLISGDLRVKIKEMA